LNSLILRENKSEIQNQTFSQKDLEYYLLLAYIDAANSKPGEIPDFFLIDEFFDYHLNFTNYTIFDIGVLGYQISRYEMTFELIEEALDFMGACFVNMQGEVLNHCQNTLLEEVDG